MITTWPEQLETIYGGSDKYDFVYTEMERIYKKLNAVYNPKNKKPFWKKNITHINSNWRDSCVSFDCNEEIVVVNLHEFLKKHGTDIDEEIELTLIKKFEKAIMEDENENQIVTKKRKEYNYLWEPLEPWEEDLYDYMETCI